MKNWIIAGLAAILATLAIGCTQVEIDRIPFNGSVTESSSDATVTITDFEDTFGSGLNIDVDWGQNLAGVYREFEARFVMLIGGNRLARCAISTQYDFDTESRADESVECHTNGNVLSRDVSALTAVVTTKETEDSDEMSRALICGNRVGDGFHCRIDSGDETPQPPSATATSVNIEIRVWESTSDPTLNYISARPEGGSWRVLGTIPLGRGDASAYEETSNGRFRYSDITLAVSLDQ